MGQALSTVRVKLPGIILEKLRPWRYVRDGGSLYVQWSRRFRCKNTSLMVAHSYYLRSEIIFSRFKNQELFKADLRVSSSRHAYTTKTAAMSRVLLSMECMGGMPETEFHVKHR